MKVAEPMGISAGFAFLDQPRPLGVGGEYGFEWTRDASRRFLRDIANAGATRQLDRPFVRIDLPDDRLHQGRLASPIAADQPKAASRRDRGRRALKYRPPAQADRNSVNSQHIGAVAFNRGAPKAHRASSTKATALSRLQLSPADSCPFWRPQKQPRATRALLAG